MQTKGFQRGGRIESNFDLLYPGEVARPAKSYKFVSPEPLKAYQEACHLFPLHTGASGAYARRAIEIILDRAGYSRKTLAQSIEAAQKEEDPDRRLPRGILQKLDYVKELGNFALHVRRDDELVIVEVADAEVAAALEIVEELLDAIYERIGEEYERAVELNTKLAAAGKRELVLPQLPEGYEPAPNGG